VDGQNRRVAEQRYDKVSGPLLRWAGGKRRLLPEIMNALPEGFLEGRGSYYEPFFGAGAVGIELIRRKGLKFAKRMQINDINPDLINLYRTLASSSGSFELFLAAYQGHIATHLKKRQCGAHCHGEERKKCPRNTHFNSVREHEHPLNSPERAAWFLFLNRTCFNGLYRVNKSGGFNVPYGHLVNPKFFTPEELLAYGEIFSSVKKISLGDFTDVTRKAKSGDFVYFDPPYFAMSETSNHTAYHQDGFGDEQQALLADEISRLIEVGAFVLASNSDTDATTKLYKTTALIPNKVRVRRSISANAESRGEVLEYLGSSYPIVPLGQQQLDL